MKTHIIRQTAEQTDVVFTNYLDKELSALETSGNIPVNKKYLVEPVAPGNVNGGRLIVVVESVTRIELQQATGNGILKLS